MSHRRQTSSADTSGSSGLSSDQLAFPPRKIKRTSSFFKESFSPTKDSSNNSFSVYFDDSKLTELSNSSSSNAENTTTENVKTDKWSHSQRSSLLSETIVLRPTEEKPARRNIAIKRSSKAFKNSSSSTSSGSRNSTPLTASSPSFVSQSGSSSGQSFILRNTSADTINTNALLQSRRASASLSQLDENFALSDSRHGISSTIPEGAYDIYDNVTGVELPRTSSRTEKESQRTISTSLLGPHDRDSGQGTEDDISYRRTSSVISSAAISDYHQTESKFGILQSKIDEEIGEDSWESHDAINPDIEEAVKLFKQEAAAAPKLTQLSEPNPWKSIPPKPSQTSLRSNQSSKISELSKTRRSTRGIQHPSLLANILVPVCISPKKRLKERQRPIPTKKQKDFTAPAIPALRKVSGSSRKRKNHAEPNEAVESPENTMGPDEIESDKMQQPLKLSHRQSRETLNQIYEYRDLLQKKDSETDIMAVQHIDSASISSHNSALNKFMDVFSIRRIIMVIMICTIAPPLYFMLGVGPRVGITDKRLMSLIMARGYREGLFAGFLWDVDVTWFRHLCIFLGCFEILALSACIGVGFGVGLSRE